MINEDLTDLEDNFPFTRLRPVATHQHYLEDLAAGAEDESVGRELLLPHYEDHVGHEALRVDTGDLGHHLAGVVHADATVPS